MLTPKCLLLLKLAPKLETRLGLSKWSAKAATDLSKRKGEHATASYQEAVGVASVMTKVWPEQQQSSNGVVVNIAVLTNPE